MNAARLNGSGGGGVRERRLQVFCQNQTNVTGWDCTRRGNAGKYDRMLNESRKLSATSHLIRISFSISDMMVSASYRRILCAYSRSYRMNLHFSLFYLILQCLAFNMNLQQYRLYCYSQRRFVSLHVKATPPPRRQPPSTHFDAVFGSVVLCWQISFCLKPQFRM